MTFLPDVNVWIALAVIEHDSHSEAIRWFETIGDDSIAFCRVTQMGFLRLLTNRHVMKGDAFSPKQAWRIYNRVRREAGARFEPEPEPMENIWRKLSSQTSGGPNFWTDAYLAAFSRATGCMLATFDRALASRRDIRAQLLGGPAQRRS
jgi:uncharacterized protein